MYFLVLPVNYLYYGLCDSYRFPNVAHGCTRKTSVQAFFVSGTNEAAVSYLALFYAKAHTPRILLLCGGSFGVTNC